MCNCFAGSFHLFFWQYHREHWWHYWEQHLSENWIKSNKHNKILYPNTEIMGLHPLFVDAVSIKYSGLKKLLVLLLDREQTSSNTPPLSHAKGKWAVALFFWYSCSIIGRARPFFYNAWVSKLLCGHCCKRINYNVIEASLHGFYQSVEWSERWGLLRRHFWSGTDTRMTCRNCFLPWLLTALPIPIAWTGTWLRPSLMWWGEAAVLHMMAFLGVAGADFCADCKLKKTKVKVANNYSNKAAMWTHYSPDPICSIFHLTHPF